MVHYLEWAFLAYGLVFLMIIDLLLLGFISPRLKPVLMCLKVSSLESSLYCKTEVRLSSKHKPFSLDAGEWLFSAAFLQILITVAC